MGVTRSQALNIISHFMVWQLMLVVINLSQLINYDRNNNMIGASAHFGIYQYNIIGYSQIKGTL